MMGFEFKILGPLEVRRAGVLLDLPAPRLRALVAALLLDADRAVPVETLIARLWGDEPPDGARNALQNYVLRVRRVLGEPGALLTHPLGYRMPVDGEALDLSRFDALVARAKADARPARMSALLAEALGLWRGRPLADVGSESLRLEMEPVLAERRRHALELRIDADLELGRHADVLGELRELTLTHPLQERFWAQRMLALYRSGRQGEALECYREAARLLADELGVDPGPQLRDLHRRMLGADPGLTGTCAAPVPVRRRGNLPAETTSFVGREAQLAQAARLLGRSRLVTMTGAGGVGKTRLALKAAAWAEPEFADGAWLVDLAPLTDPALLALTVAEALGIRDQSSRPAVEALVDQLRDGRLLLLLDNCEHVVDAVAALTGTLLRAAEGLRVLATSRTRLGLPGEHVLPVPPLDGAEAVELLADRGTASAPGFAVTDRNRDTVDRLCRRLDGIPLAIELAAVRLDTLSAAQILDRLDDRFHLLAAGSAQRTLRAVVDWSHELCTEWERLVWARLSVFAGGFDLEAAEAVCGGEGLAPHAVLDGLGGLVRKSILTADTGGVRTRYLVLETLRQYGRERLGELGKETALRERHRDHYLDVAARAAREWCGPGGAEWLALLREELPNLRAALEFCLTEPGEAEAGLRLALDLSRVHAWLFTGTPGEGRHWLESALAAGPPEPSEPRATAAAFVTWLALCQGDRASADAYLNPCRELAGPVPEAATAALAAEGAHALLALGDPEAIPLLARARKLFHHEGRTGEAHWITLLWTMAAAFLGDRATALHAGEEYLAEAEGFQGSWTRSWALWGAGFTQMCHGDRDRATALLRDAIRLQQELGDTWSPTWGVELLAWNIAGTGDFLRAARLLGAAHRLQQSFGVVLYGPFRQAHQTAEQHVRRALGDGYAAAFDQGTASPDPVRLALEG